ncbi:hypothetical protein [Streptomyces brevispora]|uniref:DUF7848 domain-containing protein n=1 Tax=Streptomyces brevispora TaxID=887462 RepID=A0ABZ1G351_9ACTN|nr:hypothetical protein [Streptomyces brevispora]WSC14317.1 hypothetical protein OIE64_16695 [Streptomyces brevispora]
MIRHADRTVGPDREPGAPGPVYEAECTTCRESSEAAERPTPPEDWAR